MLLDTGSLTFGGDGRARSAQTLNQTSCRRTSDLRHTLNNDNDDFELDLQLSLASGLGAGGTFNGMLGCDTLRRLHLHTCLTKNVFVLSSIKAAPPACRACLCLPPACRAYTHPTPRTHASLVVVVDFFIFLFV